MDRGRGLSEPFRSPGAFALVATVVALSVSGCEAAENEPVDGSGAMTTAELPEARPADVESPSALVEALYDVISGPAEEERDWDRLRSLFWPGARVRIPRPPAEGGEGIGEWDVEGFIEQGRSVFAESGFWEREIWNRTERFGNIAHVLSTYESRVGSEDSEPAGRGINSIQLLRDDGRWWIAAIAFDVELPDNPIPDRYAGEADR